MSLPGGRGLPGGSLPGGSLWGGAGPNIGSGFAPLIYVGQGLLYPALRKAGVTLGPQRTPSPAQFEDAIEELNRLLGSLNVDPFWIFSQDILRFPLNPSQKVYTIGIDPSGMIETDFPVPVPREITQAVYVFTPGPNELRYPLGILTPQMWSRIRLQDIINTIPQGIYFDRGYPIANIYIYGQPQFGDLELYVWHVVSAASSVDDLVQLPSGYDDVIVLNLACRLAPHFQLIVSPDVKEQARDSLVRVESLNAPKPVLDIGWPCGPRGGDSPWFTTAFGPPQQL